MLHVVSFSGGRSSAYLVHLMNLKRMAGDDVRFIFMDTGAEHPGTYKFIKELVRRWKINLICFRVVVNPKLHSANSYRRILVDEIGPDLSIFREITEKYGIPYPAGPFCTRVMKREVFDRYTKENLPKDLRDGLVSVPTSQRDS